MPRLVELVNRVDGLDVEAVSFADIIHRLDALPQWSVPAGDISIALIEADECRELHDTFFSDPTVTDVMTFPGDAADDHAGDIAICVPFAAEEGPLHGFNLRQEVALYLVHGWLHLAGLRDDTPEAIQAMRAAEAVCLEAVQREQLWPAIAWDPTAVRDDADEEEDDAFFADDEDEDEGPDVFFTEDDEDEDEDEDDDALDDELDDDDRP